MPTINAAEHSLLDVLRKMGPDGKLVDIAEILTQDNDILMDMTWKEGNLVTGERTVVRTSKPTPTWRKLNEGIRPTKGTTGVQDDGAAMLEAESLVDRKVAILSGNIAKYRADELRSHMESMNDTLATTLFYGNAAVNPERFTGLAPRYNSLGGVNGDQVISAAGTGSFLGSIWLIGWDTSKVTGIYPKGTKGGLQHTDASAGLGSADDGNPLGQRVLDANGAAYYAYVDRLEWNCGLSVKDHRYVVRIANIARNTLTVDGATGAKIEDLMIQAINRLHRLNGCRPVFYCDRGLMEWMERQALSDKKQFLSWSEYGGRNIPSFRGIPIRRTDALNFNETVVA